MKDAQVLTVVFAGSLIAQKGLHVFLEAMEILRSRSVEAIGVVVESSAFGNGRTTAHVKKLRQSAPPDVIFQNHYSGARLAEYLRTSDLFCISSIFDDPFPLAPLEAMASNLAVAGTQSGGIPEAFSEGGALLVAKGSGLQLAESLERFLMKAPLGRQVAEAGYASFRKRFTWSCIRPKNREIVEAVSSGANL